MFWPLAGSAARLVVVAVGGWVCVHALHLPAGVFFVAVAASLVLYAGIMAAAIWLGSWTK
jgi:hypothetical protein